jgi:hypothetical protein
MGMHLAPQLSNPFIEVPVGMSHSLTLDNRVGLHYFPDTIHYRNSDLEAWLPEFEKMGIGWLTLAAAVERAIPEDFIGGLVNSGIKPILHFRIPPQAQSSSNQITLLLKSYRRWGVQYAAFFDQPNCRANWNPGDWAQPDLVERFLDLFIPIAEIAIEEGLIPVFPPLEPGGDYWDLSFLHSALHSLERRGRNRLIDQLTLGAYAWISKKPLNWGSGGPDRWPEARPYHTPAESEDQRGFRIFDWYLATAQRALGKDFPIILLRAGAIPKDRVKPETGEPDYIKQAELNYTLLECLNLDQANSQELEKIPDDVIACNFWLLAAHDRSAYADQAWFKSGGEKLPVVNSFYRYAAARAIIRHKPVIPEVAGEFDRMEINPEIPVTTFPTNNNDIEKPASDKYLTNRSISDQRVDDQTVDISQSTSIEEADRSTSEIPDLFSEESTDFLDTDRKSQISHYILLPLYAWGAADWDLSIIQPLIQETHPTIGFSLAEARLATRVTVLGGEGAISAEAIDMLRTNGCQVERVLDDGTLVAS